MSPHQPPPEPRSPLGVGARRQSTAAVTQITRVTKGTSQSPIWNALGSCLTRAMPLNSATTSVATSRFARPAARTKDQGVSSDLAPFPASSLSFGFGWIITESPDR